MPKLSKDELKTGKGVTKICITLSVEMAKTASWNLLNLGYTVRVRPIAENDKELSLLAWKKEEYHFLGES